LALWWASRLNKVSSLRVALLCLFLFLSLFWDEIGLISYPAVLLLFPRLVFSSGTSASTFFCIPIGYAMSVRWLLPAIHAAAGFPVPPGATYAPLEKFKGWVTFASSGGARAEFNKYFLSNIRIAVMDSLGLINPALPGTALYYAIFGAIICCLVLLGILIVRRIRDLRKPACERFRDAGIVIRCAVFFGVCLLFHAILLSVVGQRTWGLYWYGAFVGLGFVIATATLLEYLRVPSLLAAAFVVLVSVGSFYVFPSTNRAYKIFHYYPYRAILLRSVFENDINRFRLSGSSVSATEMRQFTRELAQDGPTVMGAPAELLYVVYELGLNSSGEGCQPYHATFNLLRSPKGSRLDCQEGIPKGDEVKDFLGAWLTPLPVSIKPNMLSVVIEGGVPSVARTDDSQIEIVGRKLTGRLSGDGRSLLWANGATWERRSGDLSTLDGEWWFNGTCVIRKAKESDVLIVDDTYAGMVQPGNTILAPEHGAAGTLSADHKRIFWNDGSTWIRQEAR